MELSVYSQSGKKLERKIKLNKEIFGLEVNVPLLAQSIRVFEQNQRLGSAKTKDRSEVRGGGIKPRRNKYPGMARIGSYTSPLNYHGGVVFGPRQRDYSLKMPSKMRKIALYHALSDYAKDNKIHVVSKINLKEKLTSSLKKIIDLLKLEKKTLIIADKENKNLYLASRNLSNVQIKDVKNLSAYDILHASNVVILENVLDQL